MSAKDNYLKAIDAMNAFKKQYLTEEDSEKRVALKAKVTEAKKKANELKALYKEEKHASKKA